jgi:hypothetical protein
VWMEKFLKFSESRGYEGLWIKSHSVASEPPAESRAAQSGTTSTGTRTSAGPAHSASRPASRPSFSSLGSPRRGGNQPGTAPVGTSNSPTRVADAKSGVAASAGATPAASTAGSRAAVSHADAAQGASSLSNTSEATAVVVSVTPRSAQPGEDVAAVAVVTGGRGRVRTGRVEFSVNGVVHSSASVGGDGSARALLKGLRPGVFSIQARFTGSTDLLPSSSSPVQLTITPNE